MRRALLVPAFIVACAASGQAFADSLIQNGGFETGDFTGWTLNPASPVFVSVQQADTPNGTKPGPSQNGFYVHSGSYAAQLGSTSPTTLSQSFADQQGGTYQLTFWLNGDPAVAGNNDSDSFSVAMNGTNLLAPEEVFETDFTQYTFNFTGTGMDTLSFTTSDQDEYISLDDVSVTGPVSATPEPGGLVLLGTGVAAMAGAARRRFAR